jgi:outer membrane protein assembly factor BamB
MTQEPQARQPLFLVPLLIIAVALGLRYIPAWVAPMTMLHFMSLGFAPLLGLLGVLIWWLFARRVRWRDRLLGVLATILVLVLVVAIGDQSFMFMLLSEALPLALVLLAVALVLTRSWDWNRRRWLLAGCMAIGLLPWTPFRVTGQRGDLGFDAIPRWGKTAESRFLESHRPGGASGSTARERGSLAGVPASWSGFRGDARDGIVRGVTFSTDWATNPPKQRWRHPVGPAWSSFAVAGGLAFTQEQRGEDEVVVAYSLDDGSEVWVHASHERFEEPQGGPGPRATPAYDDGKVFTLGANGTVTALDAATGEKLWSHNLQEEVKALLPQWGFSGSPLVAGRAVIVFAGGPSNQGLVAYDRDTGEKLWTAGRGMFSYVSPMPAHIGGVPQVLISTDFGIEAFRPEDGSPVWQHDWNMPQMARIAMPLLLADDKTVMIPTGFGQGTRSITVQAANDETFSTETVWQSVALKPYYNDAVCHKDHCYGFDGQIFSCIDARTGERKWKGGRYGSGQVVLLADMDTLLVISDDGEVVLVAADPAGLREIARFQAIEGKTWNHPVVADGLLLVRNDEEAACYELAAGAGE